MIQTGKQNNLPGCHSFHYRELRHEEKFHFAFSNIASIVGKREGKKHSIVQTEMWQLSILPIGLIWKSLMSLDCLPIHLKIKNCHSKKFCTFPTLRGEGKKAPLMIPLVLLLIWLSFFSSSSFLKKSKVYTRVRWPAISHLINNNQD